jgi:hypothetical protein
MPQLPAKRQRTMPAPEAVATAIAAPAGWPLPFGAAGLAGAFGIAS